LRTLRARYTPAMSVMHKKNTRPFVAAAYPMNISNLMLLAAL